MAIHSSILGWRIPWTEEPSKPQAMGLQRVGHNRVTDTHSRASQEALVVKSLLSVQETQEPQVQSLDWEDPPEEAMAAHSSILAWTIPMDRGPWWATVHGITESDMTEAT